MTIASDHIMDALGCKIEFSMIFLKNNKRLLNN